MGNSLCENNEGPTEVCMNDRVEGFDMVFANSSEGHDPGIMDNNINGCSTTYPQIKRCWRSG